MPQVPCNAVLAEPERPVILGPWSMNPSINPSAARTIQELALSFSAADDAKEQIRQAIDIVDLVGKYVPLRRQGAGYVGTCPWHDDSRPSLQVNPSRQSWKCWVCDIGGDIFSFLMQREGIDFREALEMLAEQAGVDLRRGQPVKVEPGSANDKRTLYAAVAWAEKLYHECLRSDDTARAARKYLSERGIEQRSIERFDLGYSPEGWQWLTNRVEKSPFSIPVLEAVGLVLKSEKSGRMYDRFRGRVMFPIHDSQARAIAFGGRVLPETADDRSGKYINSPDTRLFHKSDFRHSDHLYGIDLARQAIQNERHVIVVEGYTDVIMAHQHGVENVVAVMGTALGDSHVKLLRRFGDRITLVLDGDAAGQRRANEILDLFIAQQVDLRVCTLPEGLDPCDFLQQRGSDAFRELVAAAPDGLQHKLDIVTRDLDLATDLHGANQALEGIVATMAKAPSPSGGATEDTRLREQQFIARLARQFSVEESMLRQRLATLRTNRAAQVASYANEELPSGESLPPLDPWQRELLGLLTQQPEAAPRVIEEIPINELPPGPGRVIYQRYHEFVGAQRQADFGRVLTSFDDPRVKNLLVELESQAARLHPDPEPKINELLAAFRRRRESQELRAQLATLNQSQLDEEEELRFLEKHIEKQRQQRGISGPTDG